MSVDAIGQTNAAVAAYDAAVNGFDDVMRNAPHNAALRQGLHTWDVDQAQAALDKAVSGELASQIPLDHRTARDASLAESAQAILQRYANDPTAHAALTDALLSDPSVKAWIAQAAQNIDQPYQGGDPRNVSEDTERARQAAQRLRSTLDGLPPELALAVAQASLPTIQKISQLKLSCATDPFSTVQGVLNSLGDGPGAQSLIDRTASYYAKNIGAVTALAGHNGANGVLAEAIATDGNGDTRFARALADQLQGSSAKMMRDMAPAIRNAGADGLHDYLANNGGSPLAAYDKAHDAADENTKHLAQLLSQTGALTPEQKQDFIKAYMSAPENADVYKNENEAAKKLADYMNANRDGLIFAAGQRGDSAKQLYQCMQDLTQSSQGTTSLSFIGSIDNDPAASKAFSKFSDYKGDFLDNTIASAQGELLVEKGGDAKSAVAALMDLAEPVFRGASGWNKLKEDFEKTSEVKANPKVLDAKELGEAFKEMGAGRRGFTMASIMVSSYNGGNAETINAMMAGYGDASAETDELTTGALRYLADADTDAWYSDSLTVATDFSKKLIPGLSLIANANGGLQDLTKAEHNPVYAGALMGDAFALMGSGVATVPGLELPGEVVSGIGMLAAAPFEWVGGAIDNAKEHAALKKEAKEYLTQADELEREQQRDKPGTLDKTRMPDQTDEDGLNAKTIDALVASDPGQIEKLQSLNMTAAEIQALGEDDPEWLQSTSKSDFLFDLARASGVQGSEVMGFADAVQKDNPNIVAALPDSPSAQPLTDNQLIHLISQRYPTAQAYVQATHPDLLGPAGAARRKADADYDEIARTSLDEDRQLGDLLQRNSDPAYQAQIINRLHQSQGLDRWVHSISQTDDGLPQAAKHAIEAAQNAGVSDTSPDSVQTYLSELG
jgi:hypothetical protein